MFTGIVQGLSQVTQVHKKPGNKKLGMISYSVTLPLELLKDLNLGASVSIDGVCQTVVKQEGQEVHFDAIQETLSRTTLGTLQPGQWVNIERSARFGDEIGGHVLSGHVYGMAEIIGIENPEHNHILTFRCQKEWMKYLFSKGYIAVDGISLTLVDVNSDGTFTVHLIPETLRQTTLGKKKQGDRVNLEWDSQTQACVETVERLLIARGLISTAP